MHHGLLYDTALAEIGHSAIKKALFKPLLPLCLFVVVSETNAKVLS